jgi:hydrogenase-4 component B
MRHPDVIDASAISAFFALCAAGVLLALITSQRRNPALLAILGAAAGVALAVAGAHALLAAHPFFAALWRLPVAGGELRIGLDPISGLFLLITGIVYTLTSIFSAGYLRRYLDHYSLRAFSVMYFALFASIAAVLIARDVISFLLAWELMSITSYLLVNYEFERQQNIRAGYLMLAMGEAGTLAAAVALILLAIAAGSSDFQVIAPTLHSAGTAAAAVPSLTSLPRVTTVAALGPAIRWAVFLLSLFGFGVKAGLMPFNSWLPRAHPVAPANVSALLSGVILNLGIYGIVRVNLDLLPVHLIGPGLVALVVGAVSAFVGILYATTENDAKTMLAHSSIENMGIIVTGLGAGFAFSAAGRPALAAIAFVAALYHLTNHSVYKALLFLGAGTVDARAGTRDLDRLGGLIRVMPWTAFFFLVGALSISAMYPFSGFASEWLTLQAILRSAELQSSAVKLVFAFAGVTLALTAALAVTCFVKAFAFAFLGHARSTSAESAREAPASMLAPMGVLAVLSLLLGVAPTYVIAALSGTLERLGDGSATQALVPVFFPSNPDHAALPREFASEFRDLGAETGSSILPGRGLVVLHRGGADNPVVFAMSTSYGVVVLAILLAVVVGVVRWVTRGRRIVRESQWDGGVRHLFPEMTYTATGFSNPVRVVFDALFRPRTIEDTEETVAQHFRVAIRRSQEPVHLVDRLVLDVLATRLIGAARFLARMHHGKVNAYVAYVLGTLIALLALSVALHL